MALPVIKPEKRQEQQMAENTRHETGMSGEVRFRIPLVVVLPLVALVVIAILAIGFSRILLSLEPAAATTLALIMAANILGACAFYALRPDTARRRWPELAAVVLYPVLIGIAVAQTGFLSAEEAEGGGGGAPAPPAGGNTIVAANTAFDIDQLTAAAGEEFTGTLENQDSVVHNIALYESEEATSDPAAAFFTSEDADGGESVEFSFPAPGEPGDYPFLCDYHPTTMTGTLVVEAGGGGGGQEGGGEE
ncbi:MAG: cupredoxin domain-containing protein [Actinomycetota bacterium]